MKTFLIIYVIGLCVAGLFESLLFNKEAYYNSYCDRINVLKEDANLDDSYMNDNFNNTVINLVIIIDSLLSWLGVIWVCLEYLSYLYERNNKN